MKNDYRKTKEGKRRFAYPIIYKITHLFQFILWKIGIAWHNRFSGECTPDFNCCTNIGRFKFIAFRDQNNRSILARQDAEPKAKANGI